MKRFLRAFITISTIFALTGCFGPSAEEKEMAKNECEKFVKEKFEKYTHVFDLWTKDGKIVVEVGYKKSKWSDEYSVRLCVVDTENGRISIPSVFDTALWKK